MTDYNQDSAQNGQVVHWFENDQTRCHPAFIAGNVITYGGYFDSADLIQLDAVNGLGVIVPLRRNAVNYDEGMTETEFPADNTWHYIGCLRAPVEL